MTKSLTMAADIAALLRSRHPLLWVVTREEARVESYLIEAAATAGYSTMTWDVAQGILAPGAVVNLSKGPIAQDVGEVLTRIRNDADSGKRTAWIMRDMHAWLQPPIGIVANRQLRNLARFLPSVPSNTAQAIIILTPVADVPTELASHATVVEWPMPDRAEIDTILEVSIKGLPKELQGKAATKDTLEAAIDAAVGLTGEEAQNCFAKSLSQLKRIDPITVGKEKKRIIARERVLEWYDPLAGGLDAVGGLAALKTWLRQRKLAYTPEAREYKLPKPKGALLVGVPGCGKSLTAKAISTAWGVPLLKMDMGALKSKFVGESEANMRKAFRTIEAIGRCVVWIDEIEKALAGATQGAADGGVSSDALGSLLSWMQERQGEAFVLATANDIEALPPELLRKGRFDEVWYVDVPTAEERVEVLKAALTAHDRGDLKVDYAKVAAACEEFTGAEIAALVPEAMFLAFADDQRELTTRDLLDVAKDVVPLTKTAEDKIAKLRKWADERARPANAAKDKRGARYNNRARVIEV